MDREVQIQSQGLGLRNSSLAVKSSCPASLAAPLLLVAKAVRRWDHREPELGIYSAPVL